MKWNQHLLTNLLGTSTTVAWAVQVGLFERLVETTETLDALAAHLECDAMALDVTLGVLEAMGLVRVRDGRVALDDDVGEALRESPGATHAHIAMWRSLGHFVQSGRAALPTDGAVRDETYAHVVQGLERRFAPAAEQLADVLGPAGGPILDVGAGSGVWSLAMAARDPASTVTALDGRETCKVFRSRAEERGFSDRVSTLPGDYHDVPLPAGRFARIVLGNVLHLESPERAAALVERVAPALRPGGSVVVVDALRDGEPADAESVAVYRLHLTMRVEGGAVYERADFEGWMRAVGLTRHTWMALPPGGVWALAAEAP